MSQQHVTHHYWNPLFLAMTDPRVPVLLKEAGAFCLLYLSGRTFRRSFPCLPPETELFLADLARVSVFAAPCLSSCLWYLDGSSENDCQRMVISTLHQRMWRAQGRSFPGHTFFTKLPAFEMENWDSSSGSSSSVSESTGSAL